MYIIMTDTSANLEPADLKKWEIEDLSIHVIHSRKLNIKAIVTLRAVVDEMKGILIPVDVCEENVSVKSAQPRQTHE